MHPPLTLDMNHVLSIVMGYLLGSLSPSALISKIKKKDLRTSGTGNLGATNTSVVFGRAYGVIVMIFDIAKAFAAFKLTEVIFPSAVYAPLLAGGAAVFGHIFPFYMKFKGGKGLAAFGGLVLAYDPKIFLILLASGILIMIAANYSVALPIYAAIVFPLLAGLSARSIAVFLITAAVGVLIIIVHRENIRRCEIGGEVKIRDYIREHIL